MKVTDVNLGRRVRIVLYVFGGASQEESRKPFNFSMSKSIVVYRYSDFESTCQKLGGQLPTLINPSNQTELQAMNDKYFSQYRFLITESAKKCGVEMLNFWIQLGEGIDLPKEDRDYHVSDSKLKHNLRVEGAKKVPLDNKFIYLRRVI